MTALAIGAAVLDEARRFFEDRGAEGCEGTAMIAAARGEPPRLVIPEQIATPFPSCSVEVTDNGKIALALALRPQDRYVARIHSHPGQAFHSRTDDANPALTQEGALSLVAPYFGLSLRRGLDACAVYRLHRGRWVLLEPGATRALWLVAV